MPDRYASLDPAVIQQFLDQAYPDGFSTRDEANSIVAFTFRRASLEEVLSKYVSVEEMQQVIHEVCQAMERVLTLKSENPEKYKNFLVGYGYLYCQQWRR